MELCCFSIFVDFARVPGFSVLLTHIGNYHIDRAALNLFKSAAVCLHLEYMCMLQMFDMDQQLRVQVSSISAILNSSFCRFWAGSSLTHPLSLQPQPDGSSGWHGCCHEPTCKNIVLNFVFNQQMYVEKVLKLLLILLISDSSSFVLMTRNKKEGLWQLPIICVLDWLNNVLDWLNNHDAQSWKTASSFINIWPFKIQKHCSQAVIISTSASHLSTITVIHLPPLCSLSPPHMHTRTPFSSLSVPITCPEMEL